jgi:type II secretory pathway pseudopilin PulG
MKKFQHEGFILTEVLIGLALTALLLQALVPLLSTSFASWRLSTARMEMHQTARMATEAMTRELRFASSVSWPLPEQPDKVIRFKKVDPSGQIQSLIFQQGSPSGINSRTLYRINSPGEPTPLTQDVVSELNFKFQPPRLIRISLTVKDAQTQITDTVETWVSCLNLPD